jgi:hypothetical protein
VDDSKLVLGPKWQKIVDLKIVTLDEAADMILEALDRTVVNEALAVKNRPDNLPEPPG